MISIIIVHYRVSKHLFDCINSIIASNPNTAYEIIVVDNDEIKTIRKDLQKKFPKVKYIPNQNKGFGHGNNLGSKQAKGEYLFFLNPDTIIYPKTIDALSNFLKNNTDTAIVAPLLLGKDKKPYQQGARELTPFTGIFSLSFINKLYPDNPVAKKYYLQEWDKNSLKEVDVIPGTAFVIKRKIFDKINGFDENFFLYFEEFDLCKRVKKLGQKIFITPEAKVLHYWGESAKARNDISQIFSRSRFYYFKKHFGFVPAILTISIVQINKHITLLLALIPFAIFLRIYRLSETMPFIPEQGWFYLHAVNLLQTGNFPLVSMASSHPWLHQGPYWTYLLAFVFWFFGYNPLNAAYMTIFIDILALILIFKTGSSMFNNRVGIIASVIYASSTAVILNARMPYHTSPIPLIAIMFIYFTYKWLSGNKYYFPLTLLTIAVLYNLELATIPFWFIVFGIFTFGLWKKKKWILNLRNRNIIIFSILAIIIPMAPVIIYDINHQYPQTIRFVMWMGYRILVLFGYPPLHPHIASPDFNQFLSFVIHSYKNLIFPLNSYVALTIFTTSLFVFYKEISKQFTKKSFKTNWITLSTIFTLSIAGFLISKTPSEAYLPMLFPGVIIITSVALEKLLTIKHTRILAMLVLLILFFGNSYNIITILTNKSPGFTNQINAAKYIITHSEGKEYNLIWGGVSPKRAKDKQNYEYLIWWISGRNPSKLNQNLKFTIIDGDTITITKKVHR